MKFRSKAKIALTLFTAALISTPMIATAGNCASKMGHGKGAYYQQALDRGEFVPSRAMSRMIRTTAYGEDNATNYRVGYYKAAHHADKATKGDVADIVDTAVSAGSFNTLVTAIKAAGLAETLKGKGPFTVFAPTDDAFAKIPKEQLDALIADKDALTKVLTYHVVPGSVSASEVVNLDSAKTVQGSSVNIDATDGVKIDNAKVIKTDIQASNGVIHVIDTVIMPN